MKERPEHPENPQYTPEEVRDLAYQMAEHIRDLAAFGFEMFDSLYGTRELEEVYAHLNQDAADMTLGHLLTSVVNALQENLIPPDPDPPNPDPIRNDPNQS